MNYKTSITAKTTTEKAFKPVSSGINKWWGKVDNSNLDKIGDKFTVYFDENTEWVFEITKNSLNKEIHWKCICANHYISGLENIEKEWLNSKIIWNIYAVENGIEVSIEHIGLTPVLNCYVACDAGWTHFIATSLKQYLYTGIGTPGIID
jgi:hypothetical protein